jgi:hypothetical protein
VHKNITIKLITNEIFSLEFSNVTILTMSLVNNNSIKYEAFLLILLHAFYSKSFKVKGLS